MPVASPPRPADPAERSLDERVAELEALIKEARERARRRRRRFGALALVGLSIGAGFYFGFVRTVPHDVSAAATGSNARLADGRSLARNGPITLFGLPGRLAGGLIESVGQGKVKVMWRCPTATFCGTPVSFAWSPDGRRVAFTLDEIGGDSSYVGLHVVNVVTGKDTHIPAGAPPSFARKYRHAANSYLQRMQARVGCWPPADLTWSPDGKRLAYRCGTEPTNVPVPMSERPHINVLRIRGSGFETIRTRGAAFWPSWSPTGNRIAYATGLLRPTEKTRIYTIALDGSHRRLVTTGGTAPAWSPDGKTIAYETRCGIRLVIPRGKDVTPRATANSCGAIGPSGPPVWSPDGTKLAIETKAGIYVMNADGSRLHRISREATTTWYGALPGRPSWEPAH